MDAHTMFSEECINLFFVLLISDPAENLQEILKNVSKQQGVSNMRKLGHLNNFVKVHE